MFFEPLPRPGKSKKIPSLAIVIDIPNSPVDDISIETARFSLNNRELDIKFNDRDFDDTALITGRGR